MRAQKWDRKKFTQSHFCLSAKKKHARLARFGYPEHIHRFYEECLIDFAGLYYSMKKACSKTHVRTFSSDSVCPLAQAAASD